MAEKLRLTGSFDEYGYRPGLAGSLAAGLMRASKPTRYPTSVTDRLIGGVFDGLATHRKMRIDDEVAIADRERREIEMETLRRNATIQRHLDQLRGVYQDPDLSVTGQTMTLPQYMSRAAMISGDPAAMMEAAKYQRLGVEALDTTLQKQLMESGIDPQVIMEINRTGRYEDYPEVAAKIQEIRTAEDSAKKAELELKQAQVDTAQEELLQKQVTSYLGAEKEWLRLGRYTENLNMTTDQIMDDLDALLDPNTAEGKALADAAGSGRVRSIENWALKDQRALLKVSIDSIKSRIAFDQLLKIKEQGGTLGALSDAEFNALANNVAAIGSELTPVQLLKQIKEIRARLKKGRDLGVKYSRLEMTSQSNTALRFGKRLNSRRNKEGQPDFNFNLGKFSEGELEGEIQ